MPAGTTIPAGLLSDWEDEVILDLGILNLVASLGLETGLQA